MLRINPYIYPLLDLTHYGSPTADIIIYAVERATGYSFDEIKAKNRHREVKDARHLLHYFLKKKTVKTLTKIAEITNRNHATVIHSVNLVNDVKDFDPYFKEKINKVNYYLYSVNNG